MRACSPVVSADGDSHRLSSVDRNLVQDRAVRRDDRVRERQDVVLCSDAPDVEHDRVEAERFLPHSILSIPTGAHSRHNAIMCILHDAP